MFFLASIVILISAVPAIQCFAMVLTDNDIPELLHNVNGFLTALEDNYENHTNKYQALYDRALWEDGMKYLELPAVIELKVKFYNLTTRGVNIKACTDILYDVTSTYAKTSLDYKLLAKRSNYRYVLDGLVVLNNETKNLQKKVSDLLDECGSDDTGECRKKYLIYYAKLKDLVDRFNDYLWYHWDIQKIEFAPSKCSDETEEVEDWILYPLRRCYLSIKPDEENEV